MNHQIPSAEDFLAQPDPAEDDLEPSVSFQGQPLTIDPGQMWEVVGPVAPFPPNDLTGYVREISASLKAIAEATSASTRQAQDFEEQVYQTFTADLASTDDSEAVQTLTEEVADLRADRAELAEVIDRIEAALGKSKAAPALAAKAVIDAWRNPQVPPAGAEGDRGPADTPTPLLDAMEDASAELAASQGHTRTPHPAPRGPGLLPGVLRRAAGVGRLAVCPVAGRPRRARGPGHPEGAAARAQRPRRGLAGVRPRAGLRRSGDRQGEPLGHPHHARHRAAGHRVMATETTTLTTCDVCGTDVEVEPFPMPLTVTDAGGASSDACSPACLLDLAVELIRHETREAARAQAVSQARRRRWLFRGRA